MKYAGKDFWQAVERNIDAMESEQARFYATEIAKAGWRGTFLYGFAWGALTTFAVALVWRMLFL